jgi:PAS domain S-box-containing protein
MTWREVFRQSPLARRLIVWTVLFSSAVTLILTGLQLYRDYRHDVNQIERNFVEIESVHLATLTDSLWATDQDRLQLQLEGMLQLRDMQYFEVREGGQVWARAGQAASKNIIQREIILRYRHDGRDQVLGTLVAVATLERVYARLLGDALTILVSNGIKTFLVAVFMLFLIYHQMTRHLLAISRFARQYDLLEPPPPLVLDRTPQEDELCSTVMALNHMHARLQDSIEKLAASEERFRYAFEQMAVGIAHIAPSGRFLRVNQKLCDIVGYTRDELIAETFQDITHPDDLDADLVQARQVLAGEIQTYSMEKRYLRKDGRIVWINLTVSLVRKADGRADYFIAVAEDIDARRHAESRLRHSETLLTEAQRMAHLGSFEWDAASGELQWSDELYRIYGVTPQEFTPTFETFLACLHPEDRERVQSMALRALEDGMPIKYEERVLRPSGEVRLVATEVSPVKGDDGRVLRLIGACHDITERKQAETERERLLNELTVRNVEMEAFIYTISHDLKSPLITIGGFSTLLEKDIVHGDRAAVTDSLAEIKKAVNLMQAHISDLLLLSRTGRVSAERTDVPLAALLDEIIGQFGRRLADENARLIIAPDLPLIRADRKGMVRVFTNLIDNALKYRHPGIATCIDIGWLREEGELKLFVRDNGIGIRPEYHERIFGLFQRAHTQVEGTGVGLAISKRVIEVHGGRMWVESKPDSGSTFWIGLPRSLEVG